MSEPSCSFCGKTAEQVRLFSGRPVAGSDDKTPFVCEECVRSFGGGAGKGDLLSLIGARLRRGLHDKGFVKGLAKQFIEFGNEALEEQGSEDYEVMVNHGERWIALLATDPVDLEAADVLHADIAARADRGAEWKQMADHFDTWLRGRKLDRDPAPDSSD